MNNAIKPGDLVMVVKPSPCCNRIHDIGRVFTVGSVEYALGSCETCGAISTENMVTPVGESNKGCVPYVLKKLDPPDATKSSTEIATLEIVS